MPILKVTKWDDFQHYKDRCPPWIKLHFSLLSSEDWVALDDASRVLAIVCMLLASRSKLKDGTFNADPVYVQRVAYLSSLPNFKPLIDCGFLSGTLADASAMQATASIKAQAKATTEERRGETENIPPNGKKTARGSRLPAEWKLPKPWGEWAISERPTWSPEEVRQCSLRFADFWHAKAGKDATKLDWLATWRNWVRNDRGGSPDRKPTSGNDWTPPLMPAGQSQ
jgi:hypothetical protein